MSICEGKTLNIFKDNVFVVWFKTPAASRSGLRRGEKERYTFFVITLWKDSFFQKREYGLKSFDKETAFFSLSIAWRDPALRKWGGRPPLSTSEILMTSRHIISMLSLPITSTSSHRQTHTHTLSHIHTHTHTHTHTPTHTQTNTHTHY